MIWKQAVTGAMLPAWTLIEIASWAEVTFYGDLFVRPAAPSVRAGRKFVLFLLTAASRPELERKVYCNCVRYDFIGLIMAEAIGVRVDS